MLDQCKTRFNLMAFIKQGDYMLKLAFKSRCLNSTIRCGYGKRPATIRPLTVALFGMSRIRHPFGRNIRQLVSL